MGWTNGVDQMLEVVQSEEVSGKLNGKPGSISDVKINRAQLEKDCLL